MPDLKNYGTITQTKVLIASPFEKGGLGSNLFMGYRTE